MRIGENQQDLIIDNRNTPNSAGNERIFVWFERRNMVRIVCLELGVAIG